MATSDCGVDVLIEGLVTGSQNASALRAALTAEDDGRILKYSYEQLQSVHNIGGCIDLKSITPEAVSKLYKQTMHRVKVNG